MSEKDNQERLREKKRQLAAQLKEDREATAGKMPTAYRFIFPLVGCVLLYMVPDLLESADYAEGFGKVFMYALLVVFVVGAFSLFYHALIGRMPED